MSQPNTIPRKGGQARSVNWDAPAQQRPQTSEERGAEERGADPIRKLRPNTNNRPLTEERGACSAPEDGPTESTTTRGVHAETRSVRRDAPAQPPYHQRRGVHAQSESHVHAPAGMYGPTPREKERGQSYVHGQPKLQPIRE